MNILNFLITVVLTVAAFGAFIGVMGYILVAFLKFIDPQGV